MLERDEGTGLPFLGMRGYQPEDEMGDEMGVLVECSSSWTTFDRG